MDSLLHNLVVQAQGAHTTKEDMFAYVDYYFDMCLEQKAEQEAMDILTAEELMHCPFDDDDLPF